METGKLAFRQKLGYASGIVSESVLYNMFYTYFIIFLTDVALVNPAAAGTISLISVLWNGVLDPVIGHAADRKEGRKKRFLLFAIIPMGLFFILSFLRVDISGGMKFLFYTLTAMLFWLSYTIYTIPYYALGAEITQDYDERTKIRGMSGSINAFAIFIGCALPTLLTGFLMGRGIGEGASWTASAAVVASVGIVFVIITWLSVRKIRLVKEEGYEDSGEGLLKTYLNIMKLKPFRYFAFYIVFYMISSAISQANLLYIIQYRVGLDAEFIGVTLVVLVLAFLIFTPLTTWLATKYDRRIAILIMFSVSAAGLLQMKIIGVTTIPALLVLSLVTGISAASFWGTFYSFAYDLCEIDELVNGCRREGAITALPQFLQKTGAAVGLWLEGIILAAVGYNGLAETQTEKAVLGIENISTVFMAVMLIGSLIAMFLYPVTKKRFEAVGQALEQKKAGKEYSTAGLEAVL